MSDEFWKSSPFGERSIFHPNWDERRKSDRDEAHPNIQEVLPQIAKDGVELVIENNQLLAKQADGYYYTIDGHFWGVHGPNDRVSICSKVSHINGKNVYHVLYNTGIRYNDLILVAGTAVGESSYGYGVENKQEIYAIANAIMNFYRYINKSNGSIIKSVNDMQAYAATKQNDTYKKFIKFSNEERNQTFFKEAIGAALNAMNEPSCIDYSNGATHWDGIDAALNGRKWKEGLKFQDPSADIFCLGNNQKYTKEKYGDRKYYERIYDYKWIATKGVYGTNSRKRNPHYPYFDGDMVNEHRFGTILMRTSDEYNRRIPYGQEPVE